MRASTSALAFSVALGSVALGIATPAVAQTPTYTSLEAGAACSRNKSVLRGDLGGGLGNDGCGATVTAEIGSIGKPVFSVLDLWAIRARYTSFKDKADLVLDGVPVEASFADRRIVLDAEVGKKTPFGMFGGTSYVTLGVRYASWTGDGELRAVSGPARSATAELSADGLGPRIGLRSTIPLGSHFMFESRSGAAALFSQYRNDASNGVDRISEKSNGTVFSIDTSSSLSYKIDGSDTGRIMSIGLVSEYWFNQSRFDGGKDNRHSWGPVARFRMPLQ